MGLFWPTAPQTPTKTSETGWWKLLRILIVLDTIFTVIFNSKFSSWRVLGWFRARPKDILGVPVQTLFCLSHARGVRVRLSEDIVLLEDTHSACIGSGWSE